MQARVPGLAYGVKDTLWGRRLCAESESWVLATWVIGVGAEGRFTPAEATVGAKAVRMGQSRAWTNWERTRTRALTWGKTGARGVSRHVRTWQQPLKWDGLPRRHGGKESASQCRRCQRHGFDPWIRKIPWSRKWKPTPVFLPGKSKGQSSLLSYRLWGGKKVRHNWALTPSFMPPQLKKQWKRARFERFV